jgi:hypothetical protein
LTSLHLDSLCAKSEVSDFNPVMAALSSLTQ